MAENITLTGKIVSSRYSVTISFDESGGALRFAAGAVSVSGNQLTVAIGTEAEILQAPVLHPDADPEALLATVPSKYSITCLGAIPSAHIMDALMYCLTGKIIAPCPANFPCTDC